MSNSSYALVKGILQALKTSGIAKVTEVGHEGMWEIELLGAGVSEIEHVVGSLSAPSPSSTLPPSHTLPPSALQPTPPHSPSYVASTHATHEAREKAGQQQFTSLKSPSGAKRSLQGKRSGRGGENLELFSKQEQFSGAEMQAFQSVWNGTFVLPKISSMKGRERALHDLLKDDFFKENWREGIKKVAASRFCRGHNRQGTGMRPWKATVDWFLQPHVLPRIIEGLYDDGKTPEITPDDQKFNVETI